MRNISLTSLTTAPQPHRRLHSLSHFTTRPTASQLAPFASQYNHAICMIHLRCFTICRISVIVAFILALGWAMRDA